MSLDNSYSGILGPGLKRDTVSFYETELHLMDGSRSNVLLRVEDLAELVRLAKIGGVATQAFNPAQGKAGGLGESVGMAVGILDSIGRDDISKPLAQAVATIEQMIEPK